MSKLTMIAGGVIGGIIGFVVSGYNPMGAWVGFSIGMGLGSIIDPMTPDVPAPGDPMTDLEIMTNVEGIPIPEVLGTTKMTGNLLYYGNNYRVELTDEVEGGGSGGGGGSEYVTGYEYYLSWAMGFCMGPIDTIYTVYKEDKVVWSGAINRPESGAGITIGLFSSYATLPSYYFNPDGTFNTSYTVEAGYEPAFIGLLDFYFGTDTQSANSTLGNLMLDDGAISSLVYNLAYLRQCWGFFRDNKIGSYNRAPTMKIVVKKCPACSFDV